MAILFDGLIDVVGLSAALYNQDEHAATNIELVSDPTGSGEQVARCTLRSTDGLVGGGYRAEIAQANAARQSWPGTYWYWFAVYIPRSAIPPVGWKQTVWQFHGPGGDAPMLFGELMPDGAVHVSANIISGTGVFDPMKYRIEPGAGTDAWLHFVVRAEWVNATDGRIEVWMDGNKIVDRAGRPTIYSTAGDLYWKAGVYMSTGLSGFPPPGASEWTVYTKGLIVGDSSYATHDAFCAAAGVPQRALSGMRPWADLPASAWAEPNGDYAQTALGTPYNLAGASGLSVLAHVRVENRIGYQAIVDDNNTSFSFNVDAPVANPLLRRLRLEVKDDVAGAHRAYIDTTYGAPMHGKRWWWAAATCQFSDGRMRFFLDGAEQQGAYLDAQAGFTPAPTASAVRLGARTANTLQWWGALASIRIFKRVLAPAEIAAWYGTDRVLFTTQLVSWWKFDQSSGAVIDAGPAAQNAAWQVGCVQRRPAAARSAASQRYFSVQR